MTLKKEQLLSDNCLQRVNTKKCIYEGKGLYNESLKNREERKQKKERKKYSHAQDWQKFWELGLLYFADVN